MRLMDVKGVAIKAAFLHRAFFGLVEDLTFPLQSFIVFR